ESAGGGVNIRHQKRNLRQHGFLTAAGGAFSDRTWLPARNRMAPVIGHARAVAAIVAAIVTAVIAGVAAIVVGRRRIVGGAAVIAVGVIVVGSGIRSRNREPGADDAGGQRGGRSTSTSAIVASAIVAA